MVGSSGPRARDPASLDSPRGHHREARGAHQQRAWWVAGVTMAALVAAAGFRSSTGALLEPLEHEFGWSRATTSGAVSLNLVIYGLTAPFAAALMERFGVRRVVALALTLVAAGAGLTLVMTSAWQLWFLWGVPIGVGTGAMALVFGAIVANRWFVRHRGLVTGVFSAASSTGQLIFLPAIAQLAHGPGLALGRGPGGRVRAAARAGRAGRAARPALRRRRGAVRRTRVVRRTAGRPRRTGPGEARADHAARDQPPLDLLGAVPDVLDLRLVDQRADRHPLHPGRPRPRDAGDDVGRPARADRRSSTSSARSRRAGSPTGSTRATCCSATTSCAGCQPARRTRRCSGPHVQPSLFLFIVFYGLDWVATVPPTVALCRIHFGLEKSGVVFGWVFASHMVGAGVAASYAGWIRQGLGDYFVAWMTAGGLCLLAALMCLSIPRARPPGSRRWSRSGRSRRSCEGPGVDRWPRANPIWRIAGVSDKIVRLLRRDCRGADIDY